MSGLMLQMWIRYSEAYVNACTVTKVNKNEEMCENDA